MNAIPLDHQRIILKGICFLLSVASFAALALDVTVRVTDAESRISASVSSGNVTRDNFAGAKSVTSCTNSPVMLDLSTPVYFNNLQSAFNDAANGNTIESQWVTLTESDNFSQNISTTLQGGYDCAYSNETAYSTIAGTLTISNGTLVIKNVIIEGPTGSSQPGTPSEPWPNVPPGSATCSSLLPISYIAGTSCPAASMLECSQQIANDSGCFYQSCECYFSECNVGDTDSGFWRTYDANGNITSTLDCQGIGLNPLQISEGSCSTYNSQVATFVTSCTPTTSTTTTTTTTTSTTSTTSIPSCTPCYTQYTSCTASPACNSGPLLQQSNCVNACLSAWTQCLNTCPEQCLNACNN